MAVPFVSGSQVAQPIMAVILFLSTNPTQPATDLSILALTIPSEDLRDRDFAEFFLIGSLASVLVALCAGLVMRFALSALWPELLSLHIQ